VSAEQKLPPVELRTALLALCEGLPAPRIELLCDDSTAGVPPAIAHTLFRVVQEAISNCIRHAGASLMRVRLSGCGDAVTLQVQDNGTGARGTMEQAGSGLRGMRERVERHGGRLSAGNRPEGGFSLTVWLPLAGQA
jgi:signal transduction histidine kinase